LQVQGMHDLILRSVSTLMDLRLKTVCYDTNVNFDLP
jgi:hypothetical protein